MLGNAYHHTGQHKKEQKIFDVGRERWPRQKSTFDYWQAVCAISRGDSTEANYYLERIREMTEQRGWPEANLYLWYAGVYDWAESFEQAEYYYRKAYSIRSDNQVLLGEFALFLIDRDINLDEGLKYIAPLVEDYPQNATYLYTYGLGLYKKGEYVKARDALQKAWDLRAYYDHKNHTLLHEVVDILDRG
jgi:tetratricopeptide (TPR) repeat protein